MITTHVLDTALGVPAAGVPISLDLAAGAQWVPIGVGHTDGDGRLRTLSTSAPLVAGTYRIRFDTAAYFAGLKTDAFFPFVEIHFVVRDPAGHYHVPLLLSPFGYSTYRGS